MKFEFDFTLSELKTLEAALVHFLSCNESELRGLREERNLYYDKVDNGGFSDSDYESDMNSSFKYYNGHITRIRAILGQLGSDN